MILKLKSEPKKKMCFLCISLNLKKIYRYIVHVQSFKKSFEKNKDQNMFFISFGCTPFMYFQNLYIYFNDCTFIVLIVNLYNSIVAAIVR